MVEIDVLICVVAFIYTVCFYRCGDGWSCTDGVIILNFKVSEPAIVGDFDSPQSMLGVLPPSEDNFPIEGD